MKNLIVRDINGLGGYNYVIYPETYINPISRISKLNEDLKQIIGKPCKILFDLLLCNGDNFNRFVDVFFDGEKVDRNSINIVELDESLVDKVEEYYSEDYKRLTSGVLSPHEYLLHC